MPARRTKGAGSVYRPSYRDQRSGEKRAASVWWISYTVGGRRIRESAKTTRKGEAEGMLRQRLEDAGQGGPLQRDLERVTFDQLEEAILRDYRRNGFRSLPRLKTSLRHLRGYFGGWAVPAIDAAAIDRYTADRTEGEEGAANATVNRELSALKRMLRLGRDLGLVGRVPKIQTLRENNVRKGFVEEADLRAILKHLPEEYRPLIEVAYLTGWRKSELLSREWRHVDLKVGWLRLDPGETKSGEGRQFPIMGRLREILEAQAAKRREVERETEQVISDLFYHYEARKGVRAGSPIRNPDKAWRKARDDAGLSHIVFHDLRRSAVRALVRAGVPDVHAMKLTGHKTRSVFDRYAITSPEDLQDAVERLERQSTGKASRGARISQSTAKVSPISEA
jgi:integrase